MNNSWEQGSISVEVTENGTIQESEATIEDFVEAFRTECSYIVAEARKSGIDYPNLSSELALELVNISDGKPIMAADRIPDNTDIAERIKRGEVDESELDELYYALRVAPTQAGLGIRIYLTPVYTNGLLETPTSPLNIPHLVFYYGSTARHEMQHLIDMGRQRTILSKILSADVSKIDRIYMPNLLMPSVLMEGPSFLVEGLVAKLVDGNFKGVVAPVWTEQQRKLPEVMSDRFLESLLLNNMFFPNENWNFARNPEASRYLYPMMELMYLSIFGLRNNLIPEEFISAMHRAQSGNTSITLQESLEMSMQERAQMSRVTSMYNLLSNIKPGSHWELTSAITDQYTTGLPTEMLEKGKMATDRYWNPQDSVSHRELLGPEIIEWNTTCIQDFAGVGSLREITEYFREFRIRAISYARVHSVSMPKESRKRNKIMALKGTGRFY